MKLRNLLGLLFTLGVSMGAVAGPDVCTQYKDMNSCLAHYDDTGCDWSYYGEKFRGCYYEGRTPSAPSDFRNISCSDRNAYTSGSEFINEVVYLNFSGQDSHLDGPANFFLFDWRRDYQYQPADGNQQVVGSAEERIVFKIPRSNCSSDRSSGLTFRCVSANIVAAPGTVGSSYFLIEAGKTLHNLFVEMKDNVLTVNYDNYDPGNPNSAPYQTLFESCSTGSKPQ
jgi:hypothetical protein